MLGTRALAVLATAAFAVVSVAPGAMAQAAKPAAAKAAPAAKTVKGKIVAIDAPLSMITLADGNTYLIKDAAAFKKMKVGATISLKISS